MIGNYSGANLVAVLAVLFVCGLAYNSLVGYLERKHYTEGFLSLVVALGVLMTIVGVAVLSVEAALLTLMAFAASGAPMIGGSIARYIIKREKAKTAIVDCVNNDNRS